MNTTLDQLSIPDLVLLVGLADKPILGDEPVSATSLEQCIAWILGRRGWSDLVREALGRGEVVAALMARARGYGAGEKLPEALEVEVSSAWEELRHRTAKYRGAIASLPEAAETGSWFEEVARVRRDAAAVADLGASVPGSIKDIQQAVDAIDRLHKLADDAELARQIVSDEVMEQRRALLHATRSAILGLLTSAEDGDARMGERNLLIALRAVPELMREHELDLLAQLAQPRALFDEELLADLSGRFRAALPVSPGVFAALDQADSRQEPPPIHLSAISDTLYSAESPAPRGLEARAEFEATRKQLQVFVSDREVASRWMRLARATSIPELQRLALGQALLAHGRAQLDRDQYRLAGELLRDAVIALTVPKEWFDTKAFDDASMALVTSRVWPRMAPSRSPGARPSELAAKPDVILDWLFENDAVEVVAELWADMPDGSDEHFFEVLQLRFANALELRHACASAALTAARLRARPMWTMRRILRLLDKAKQTHHLSEVLFASATELQGADSVLKAASRKVLTSAAESIRAQLTGGLSDPLAVAIGTRLGDLLERIASADAHGGEARLAISPAVKTFFPRECATDVYLPITIENDKAGGPASEMSVQVSYDGLHDEYSPQIDAGEFIVPLLDPEDSYTGHALLQLHEDAAHHTPAWSFKATLLRGSEVVHSVKFSVAVREHSARPNPFSAGSAIQENQHFVGREAELQMLLDAFCGDRRDVMPFVCGLRRIGKTSLVHRLLRHSEVSRRYLVHYWDIEDLQSTYTTAQFLTHFAERVRDLVPEVHWPRVRFRRDQFRADPYTAFETFCDSVASLELPQLILIAIDEFDHLIHLIRDGESRGELAGQPLGPNAVVQPQTLGALRKMLMKGGSIRLVLAGLPDLLKSTSYKDRLFGLLHPIEVGPFRRQEADEVVRMSGKDMPFPPAVRDRLYDATGMQPYLLQLVCWHIYARMMRSGRDTVTTLDLQEVIDLDIVPNETSFTDYVSLIQDQDRALLRALALAQKAVAGRRRYVTPGEVAGELWKTGESSATVESVTQHLRALAGMDRPLVTTSGDYRGNFRLVIGLLGEHLIRRSL